MKIEWLGHAAFSIITRDGVRIITDPYESGAYDGALAYGPIKMEADIITVSHEQHPDHYHTSDIKGDPVIVTGLGEQTVKGVNIGRVHTYHDTSGGKERGENFVTLIQADGLRICHCGDLGHIPTDDQTKQIGRPDLLLLPVGGMFTIGPAEADEMINLLKPRMVIPMHYKTEKCGFPLATIDEFLEKKEAKEAVKRIQDSQIEIQAGSLPEATEIVVLEHAL